MAEATATHAAHKPAATPETEKEKADRELKERLEKEGPSTLLVPAPESEVDKLRKEGVEVTDHNTAGLPAGGPANIPGMSSGGPVPTKEEVQKGLDERAKERKVENKEKK